MNITQLHHVSLVTSDLERSARFYQDVLGMRLIPRPAFDTTGVWLTSGPVQIHLIANANGTFRSNRKIDSADTHFALKVDDFEAAMRDLKAAGLREDVAEGDPMRLVIKRDSVAGYPQAYFLDADRHIIEINAAQ